MAGISLELGSIEDTITVIPPIDGLGFDLDGQLGTFQVGDIVRVTYSGVTKRYEVVKVHEESGAFVGKSMHYRSLLRRDFIGVSKKRLDIKL